MENLIYLYDSCNWIILLIMCFQTARCCCFIKMSITYLVPEGDINPVMQSFRHFVALQNSPVLLYKQLRIPLRPGRQLNIIHIRMTRLDNWGVREVLGDTLVRSPFVESFHRRWILLRHPVRSHMFAQNLNGSYSSFIHVVGYIREEVGHVMWRRYKRRLSFETQWAFESRFEHLGWSETEIQLGVSFV